MPPRERDVAADRRPGRERRDARRAEVAARREQAQREREARASVGVMVDGLGLVAPDGSRWKLVVDNDGNLTTALILPASI